MPKVLNRHHPGIPAEAIYIGRGTPYGNPFEIPRDGNRQQVIEKFTAWIETQPKLIERVKVELKGKDLVCSCKPASCHGDLLLQIANGGTITPVEAKPKKRTQQGLFA